MTWVRVDEKNRMLDITINVNVNGKRRRRRPIKLHWAIGPISEQRFPGLVGEKQMLKLTNTQQASLSISAVDRKGRPAQVDSIVFTSSDPNVATVEQDTADPSKALLKAVDAGTAQINVTADADLGDGVSELSGVLDVTVVAGQAVALSIGTGTPEEQP
jgi:hypothetical protein